MEIPTISAITPHTICRELSAPKGVDIEQFGANHFNDPGKGFLYFLVYCITFGLRVSYGTDICEKSNPKGKVMASKETELNAVNGVIWKALKTNKKEIRRAIKELKQAQNELNKSAGQLRAEAIYELFLPKEQNNHASEAQPHITDLSTGPSPQSPHPLSFSNLEMTKILAEKALEQLGKSDKQLLIDRNRKNKDAISTALEELKKLGLGRESVDTLSMIDDKLEKINRQLASEPRILVKENYDEDLKESLMLLKKEGGFSSGKNNESDHFFNALNTIRNHLKYYDDNPKQLVPPPTKKAPADIAPIHQPLIDDRPCTEEPLTKSLSSEELAVSKSIGEAIKLLEQATPQRIEFDVDTEYEHQANEAVITLEQRGNDLVVIFTDKLHNQQTKEYCVENLNLVQVEEKILNSRSLNSRRILAG